MGLAKVSWNVLTREYVTTESRVLAELGGKAGTVRTPLLSASGSLGREHYLVAEPLPHHVAHSGGPAGLSLRELTGMFAITRSDQPTRSAQLLTASRRLRATLPIVGAPAMHEAFEALWAALLETSTRVSIAERWHGDLVPWNLGRDADGQAWLWDWESSEADAVAGLDAIHWTIHSQPGWERQSVASNLRKARPAVEIVLCALGHGRQQQRVVCATYALTIAARMADLAAAHGDWQRVRISQMQATDLLRLGKQILTEG